MKTIILAILAVFAFSHNVMADDTDVKKEDTTKTTDNGDGTQTTMHKHMKRGHGTMKMKKSEKTEKMEKSDEAPAEKTE